MLFVFFLLFISYYVKHIVDSTAFRKKFHHHDCFSTFARIAATGSYSILYPLKSRYIFILFFPQEVEFLHSVSDTERKKIRPHRYSTPGHLVQRHA